MQRREFLTVVGGTLVLIPAGLFLVRCGGSNQNGNGPTNQPTVSGTKVIYTSSIVEDHSHMFGIEMGAIDMPPADGVNGPSTVAEGHSHSVAVSATQLSSIKVGQMVEVTTGNTEGHTHVFSFLRLA